MSLSSMLRDKNYTELHRVCKDIIPTKKDFYTNVKYPAFSHSYEIIVPNNLTIKQDSGTVGTAFDLMARMIVAKTIKDIDLKVLSNLVAENALTSIRSHDTDLLNNLKKNYDKCITKFSRYILGRNSDWQNLVPLSCYIAELERIYRSGYPPNEGYSSLLNKIREEIINEVCKLCDVFVEMFLNTNLVTSDSRVVFNPTMGNWSRLCGGADADILIDGVLYDFKSSKNKGYSWREIAQLYSYYLLYSLEKNESKISEEEWIYDYEINSIAFYRARFGIVEKFDIIKNVSNKEAIQKFKFCIDEINKNRTVDMRDRSIN